MCVWGGGGGGASVILLDCSSFVHRLFPLEGVGFEYSPHQGQN